MKKKLTLADGEINLNSIPTPRRHLYFYTMLILTAVVLSNMKDSLFGDPVKTAAKARQAASRIVGKEPVQALK